MALVELNYFSKALNQSATVNVLLPEVEKNASASGLPEMERYKTLYLFHGLSRDRTVWLRRSNIERYAEKYKLAVVMPEVGRSWYTDMCNGEKYFTFVTEELPDVCRRYFKGMSDRREDNFVGGYSMGGYGAVKAAVQFPERYCGCISLSGSLDVARKGSSANMPEWRAIFDYGLNEPSELEGSIHDVYAAVRRQHMEGAKFPKFYLWCGSEDSAFLVRTNREFHELLEEAGIEHCYTESEGDHSWKWWDLHIQDGLKYILE